MTTYDTPIEGDGYIVRDVNTLDDGEVGSLLIEEPPGHPPKLEDGSTENVLLYVHGLRNFLKGERSAKLSDDPYIAVRPTSSESVYQITVGDRPVESMPHQSNDVLRAVQSAIDDNDLDPIVEIYKEIIDSQVRRDVVNDLIGMLDGLPRGRIRVTDSGWLVDEYYLVDWTASVYVVEGGRDSTTYTRSGQGVSVAEKDHEFVELSTNYSPERKQIKFPDGETNVLGEREMMFLMKVKWLLKRTQYHQDEPFWRFNERRREEYLSGGDDE